MKFMMTFNWKPDTKTREEGIARFRETGGQPPNGGGLPRTAAHFGASDGAASIPFDV